MQGKALLYFLYQDSIKQFHIVSIVWQNYQKNNNEKPSQIFHNSCCIYIEMCLLKSYSSPIYLNIKIVHD